MRRRDRKRLAERELVEFRGGTLGQHAFGLVHRQHQRSARSTQQVGDDLVLRRQAFAAVDQEHDDVGFGDRGACLLRHRVHDPRRRLGLEAAGVDDEIRPVAAEAASVVAVARQSRKVGDQRVARLRESVEQR